MGSRLGSIMAELDEEGDVTEFDAPAVRSAPNTPTASQGYIFPSLISLSLSPLLYLPL